MTDIDRDRLRKLLSVNRSLSSSEIAELTLSVPALLDTLEATESQHAELRARLAAAEALRATLIAEMRHPYKGPNDTDASMLREAAKRVDNGFLPGGSNTQATVARVLRAVAALAPVEQPAPQADGSVTGRCQCSDDCDCYECQSAAPEVTQ